jgi:hypothetical protein
MTGGRSTFVALLLIVPLLASGCGETKQRSYSAFIACMRDAGFQPQGDQLLESSRARLPAWLDDVAELKSRHGNYVIVMFVSADEARARARQRASAAIDSLGSPPSGTVVGVKSAGHRVWFWTRNPRSDDADAFDACL